MRRSRARPQPVLEYHDTAVGRLPRGPAADAALAAAALSEGRAPDRHVATRLLPAAAAAALAALVAIVLWRRSTP